MHTTFMLEKCEGRYYLEEKYSNESERFKMQSCHSGLDPLRRSSKCCN